MLDEKRAVLPPAIATRISSAPWTSSSRSPATGSSRSASRTTRAILYTSRGHFVGVRRAGARDAALAAMRSSSRTRICWADAGRKRWTGYAISRQPPETDRHRRRRTRGRSDSRILAELKLGPAIESEAACRIVAVVGPNFSSAEPASILDAGDQRPDARDVDLLDRHRRQARPARGTPAGRGPT